jgi:hypothetical protein
VFFCRDCAEKRGWSGLFYPFSYGPCEVCDKTRGCAEIPSAVLASYDKQKALAQPQDKEE